jgi:homoserine kinase
MSGQPAAATAFAPASVGNVGVGFDLLGLAAGQVGDRVTARRVEDAGVSIAQIRATGVAAGAEALPRETMENTGGIAAAALWRDFGPSGGVELVIEKGIPLGSGMGSSAASAVAAAVAVNALLDEPLGHAELVRYALEGERHASKALHADNVAPSLFGGLVLCPARLLPRVIRLPVPSGVVCVLVHPHLTVRTADARRALAAECLLRSAVEQQGCLASFIAACYRDDVELIGRCLRDILIEPQRAIAVPGFEAVKEAAFEAGALGSSLSGSGPSVFAWAREGDGEGVRAAMVDAFSAAGIESESWINPLDAPGAFVEYTQ